jgi:aspartyl-tRNA(Asn)/glutamyl-tRNA(Gln) amidotransferase subunit A
LLAKEKSVLKGKAILDEFACGGTGLLANSGPITNPYNSEHITGGSSSGSALAVAQKLVSFALGSDTGGSIRQPAAYCGVVGFKPSAGLISRYGLIPLASTLDTVGILANSASTVQKIFLAIAQTDPNDLLTVSSKQLKVKPINLSRAKKIAVLERIEKYLSPEFAKLYQKVITILKKNKYQVETIKIPSQIKKNLQLAYLIICSSELVSHLNACQGITFGLKKKLTKSDNYKIEHQIQQNRTDYLGKSVRRRLLLGSYFLQNKNDCEQAYLFRQKVENWSRKIFRKHNFLLFPSTNSEASKVDQSTLFFTGSQTHWSDNLLLIANFGGFPSLSLPIGLVNGLPVGININTAYKQDNLLFQLAKLIESKISLSSYQNKRKSNEIKI